MPKKNLIYVFFPRETRPEIVAMIEAAIKDTSRELVTEIKGRSFTLSDYLTSYKTKLSGKLAGLPIKARIAIIQNVERDVPPDEAARRIGIWDERNETFKLHEIFDFEKVIDPYTSSSTNSALGIVLLILGLAPSLIRIYYWLSQR